MKAAKKVPIRCEVARELGRGRPLYIALGRKCDRQIADPQDNVTLLISVVFK